LDVRVDVAVARVRAVDFTMDTETTSVADAVAAIHHLVR
jgi:hypothetical protein